MPQASADGRCGERSRSSGFEGAEAGKSLRKRIWDVYARAIQDVIGSRLTSAQAGKLSELLGRLSGCCPPGE